MFFLTSLLEDLERNKNGKACLVGVGFRARLAFANLHPAALRLLLPGWPWGDARASLAIMRWPAGPRAGFEEPPRLAVPPSKFDLAVRPPNTARFPALPPETNHKERHQVQRYKYKENLLVSDWTFCLMPYLMIGFWRQCKKTNKKTSGLLRHLGLPMLGQFWRGRITELVLGALLGDQPVSELLSDVESTLPATNVECFSGAIVFACAQLCRYACMCLALRIFAPNPADENGESAFSCKGTGGIT